MICFLHLICSDPRQKTPGGAAPFMENWSELQTELKHLNVKLNLDGEQYRGCWCSWLWFWETWQGSANAGNSSQECPRLQVLFLFNTRLLWFFHDKKWFSMESVIPAEHQDCTSTTEGWKSKGFEPLELGRGPKPLLWWQEPLSLLPWGWCDYCFPLNTSCLGFLEGVLVAPASFCCWLTGKCCCVWPSLEVWEKEREQKNNEWIVCLLFGFVGGGILFVRLFLDLKKKN